VTPRPRSSGRLHGDSGAALVEFALVAPVIVLFLVGIIEYGTVFKTNNQLQSSLMSAGRVAGQGSDAWTADYEALRSLDSTLSGLKNAKITKVIIYKVASGDTGKVSAACLAVTPNASATAGVAGSCNVYSATQVKALGPSPGFNDTCSISAWDSHFCPNTRAPQSDRIGVYVELAYTPLTGLVPTNKKISGYAVYDVEPVPIGS